MSPPARGQPLPWPHCPGSPAWLPAVSHAFPTTSPRSSGLLMCRVWILQGNHRPRQEPQRCWRLVVPCGLLPHPPLHTPGSRPACLPSPTQSRSSSTGKPAPAAPWLGARLGAVLALQLSAASGCPSCWKDPRFWVGSSPAAFGTFPPDPASLRVMAASARSGAGHDTDAAPRGSAGSLVFSARPGARCPLQALLMKTEVR